MRAQIIRISPPRFGVSLPITKLAPLLRASHPALGFLGGSDKVNLEPRTDVMMLETLGVQVLAGEVSTELEPTEPFEWLAD